MLPLRKGRWQSDTTPVVVLALLLLFPSIVACIPAPVPLPGSLEVDILQRDDSNASTVRHGQDMYGIGVRIGSYLQGFAFVLGYAVLDDLDPQSQFAGVILALQLLVRWWSHYRAQDFTLPELWGKQSLPGSS